MPIFDANCLVKIRIYDYIVAIHRTEPRLGRLSTGEADQSVVMKTQKPRLPPHRRHLGVRKPLLLGPCCVMSAASPTISRLGTRFSLSLQECNVFHERQQLC